MALQELIKSHSKNNFIPRQGKAEGVHHHQTDIIRNIRDFFKKGEKKNINLSNKMAITMFLSIIILNVNKFTFNVNLHLNVNK